MTFPNYFCKYCIPCYVWSLTSLFLYLRGQPVTWKISINAWNKKEEIYSSGLCRLALSWVTPSMLCQVYTVLPQLSPPVCADPKDQPKVEAQNPIISFLSIQPWACTLHSRFPGICDSPLKSVLPQECFSLASSFPDLCICLLLACLSHPGGYRQCNAFYRCHIESHSSLRETKKVSFCSNPLGDFQTSQNTPLQLFENKLCIALQLQQATPGMQTAIPMAATDLENGG